MKKNYLNIKAKIKNLESAGYAGLKMIFYRIFLGLLKYLIVLFYNSGISFPLVFQSQDAQSVSHSYKEFKSYQGKARFLFLLLIILALIAVKI